jgi:hypothetical protein
MLGRNVMKPMKIVVRYMDGQIIKGYSEHFDPESPSFLLYEDPGGISAVELAIDKLKAVFLVKSLEGNPDYSERKVFHRSESPRGRKVEVKFLDGEVMQGIAIRCDAQRSGFFLIPPDPESNNISIYAVSKAVINLHDL